MSRKVKTILISFVVGMVIGFALSSLFVSRKEKVKTNTLTVIKRDSITIYDTVQIDNPTARDSVMLKYETVKLPVANSGNTPQISSDLPKQETASILIHDTVEVEVPIVQKVYSDSTYTAYISGYQPKLDSIQVYPKTNIVHEYITTTNEITKTITKNKRFGVSLTGGYGYGLKSKDFQPFIGIGISYRIF